jgi:hypothetical protein
MEPGNDFGRAGLRQRELPPPTLDAADAPLVLDLLPKLLVDDSHLGRSRRLAVPNTREGQSRSMPSTCPDPGS